MNKTPVDLPAMAGPTSKTVSGKGESIKKSPRRTCARAVGLGLMLIVSKFALLDVQASQALTETIEVDFNSAGELVGLFNNSYALPAWSQNITVGLSGSGGITIPDDSSDLYICKQGFPLQVGATYTVSAFYLNEYDSGYGGLGFTTLSSGTINGGYATPLSAIGVSFHGGGGFLDNNSAASSVSNSVNWNTSIEADPLHWFYFQQTLTVTETNTFSQTFEIWQCDTYGEPVTELTTTTTNGQINATLGAATIIYPFFGASQSRFIAADSFNATTTATGLAVTPPTNQVVAVGETVHLSVTAAGAGPIGYQWLKDGHILPGATNSSLTLANAGMTNSGVYYVAVTGAAGLRLSQPATVRVGSPQLFSWGNNQYGQLGDGSNSNRSLPETVATNVVAAAAGQNHSLFLKSDGTLWTMGNNGNGQLGDGTTISRSNAVSVASNVVAVAAGANHSLFLKNDGTVWATGNNGDGQFGNHTTTSQTSPVSVASNMVAIATGANHSLFLKNDGTLWASGYNLDGELGDGTTANRQSPVAVQGGTNVIAVAAGSGVTLFLKSDYTLWAIGYNDDGELGDGTKTNRSTPIAVQNGGESAAAAAGANHSIFLRRDGTVWAMGYNYYGQLGDGTTTERTNPVSVASNVAAITAGADHSLFLKPDGTLRTMGYNSSGQLGDGTTVNRSNAVPIVGLELASVVSGPVANHTLAVGVARPPVITSQPMNQTAAAGSPVTFTVAASGLAPLSYQWQFNGTNLSGATATNYNLSGATTANTGDYTVVVTNLYGCVTSSVAVLTVNQAAPNVSIWPTATPIIYGQTLASSTLTGGAASVDGSFAFTAPATAPPSTGMQSVTFTPADSANYSAVSGSVSVIVNPATATITLGNLSQTYDGAAKAVTVSSSPTNLAVELTYNGLMVAPTNAGSYIVIGMVIDANYEGSVTNTLVINQATPIVNTWPTATTITYGQTLAASVLSGGAAFVDGSFAFATPDIAPDAGTVSQAAIFTPTDTIDYTKVSGLISLTVQPATTTIALSNLNQTYDGSAKSVMWSISPTNLTVLLTYNGSLAAPTNAGNYLVVGTVSDTNYAGSVTNTLVIGQATATVTLTNLIQTYDGTAKAVTAITSPTNFTVVLTYDGSINAPTNVASYLVVGTIVDPNYQGSITNTLVINQPTAVLTVAANPIDGGDVTGGGTFAVGSTNPITAVASNGWVFAQWSDLTTNLTNLIVLSSNLTLTATFVPAATVTLVASPSAGGWTTGDGNYPIGSDVSITATASNNWRFSSWNDGDTNDSRLITVPATNITYTASFVPTATIIVVASPNNGGSASGGGTFLVGSTNWITATASNNWIFVQWNDGSTSNSHAIVVESNRTYTAEFLPAAMVTAVVAPAEGGYVIGDGLHAIGSTARLTATASNGWHFLNWNGTVTNYTKFGDTNRTVEFTVTSNTTYTANFAPVENDFVYTVINNAGTPEAKIIGYNGSTTEKIVIPSVIGGLAVTGIGTGAFWWNRCSKISIPESVKTVEESSVAADSITFTGGADAVLPFLADGAFAVASEVILDYALPAAAVLAALDVLKNIFENLVTVDVTAAPESGGTCSGNGLYLKGTTVPISATPTSGWRFTHWDNGISTNRNNTATAPSSHTANFVQLFSVTVLANPTDDAGTVAVEGEGPFVEGDLVTITAEAEEGWEFHDWSDCTTNPTNMFLMPAHDVTYTATFYVEVEGEAEPTNGGNILGNGFYPQGSPVQLTAVPNTGWRFNGWFVESESTNNPLTNATIAAVVVPAYTLPPLVKYKAHFKQVVQVTGLANPTNAGSVAGSDLYDVDDTNITLTATASNNWQFVHWSDGTTNNPYTITLPPDVTTNIIYTADFAPTSIVAVASSLNPSGYKDSVFFTGTLPTNLTGEVVFSSPGGTFSTNSLTNGVAVSLTLTNLPRGTNLITATYLGSNYPGSTNTLEQVVTNHPPVATEATYYRVKGYSLKIALTNLLTNVTDADGDPITLQSLGASSQGATITTNGTYIFYLPSASTTTNDSFTYTVSDGFGGRATTNILVMVYNAAGPGKMSQPTNGVVNLTFYGIPNYTYVVETTTDLAGPWWTISTNVAGPNGAWEFTDPNATNAQQYYRAAQP